MTSLQVLWGKVSHVFLKSHSSPPHLCVSAQSVLVTGDLSMWLTTETCYGLECTHTRTRTHTSVCCCQLNSQQEQVVKEYNTQQTHSSMTKRGQISLHYNLFGISVQTV